MLWGTAAVLALAGCGEGGMDQGPLDLTLHEVTDVGFQVPGAVIHDPADDVYLVSNIGGPPGQRTQSGFISRVSPEGEVLDLEWIRLAGDDLALHSPRGMALRGDSLFVTDLDCLRIFTRSTGSPVGRTCLEGSAYLTDVDVGPEGSIFVTDSGLQSGDNGMEPSGSDAVYRLVLEEGRQGATLARSPELGHPSGLAVGNRGIFVTTSGTGEIFRLTPAGEQTVVLPGSGRPLEGVVFLPDGGFAYSSPGQSAIRLVTGEGRIVRLLDEVADPGILGYDEARHRLLVPLKEVHGLLFIDLPPPEEVEAPT